MDQGDLYVISDGDKYMYRETVTGRWSSSRDIKRADKYTYSKAQNVIVGQFPKKERANLKIEQYITKKSNIIEITKDKCVPKPRLSNKVFSSSSFDWGTIGKDLQKFYDQIIQYRIKVKSDLEDVEKEKCDLEHYMEFAEKFNACEGYKMAKEYHNCRVHRRQLKNDALRLEILLESKPEDFAEGRVSRRLAGIETQKYEPRILKELFEVS